MLEKSKDKTAIIILNWNGSTDTIETMQSLISNKCSYDIYLVDNGSKTEDLASLKAGLNSIIKYKETKLANLDYYNGILLIISDTNLGFAGANNYVSEKIAPFYDTITLLNNDVEVEPNFIDKMYKTMQSEDLTAVTCDIRYYSDKKILWNDGGKFTWYGDRKYIKQVKIDKYINKGKRYIITEFITGCCMMVKSEYIINNHLFSDKFFHGEEDFNFCKRLKVNGYRVGVDLSARIYHKVGRSLNYDKNDIKFLNKMILHYTNRLVDMRDFYGRIRWCIWKNFYCLLLFFKNTISLRSLSKSMYITRNILKNAHLDNVGYDNFTKIISKGEKNDK